MDLAQLLARAYLGNEWGEPQPYEGWQTYDYPAALAAGAKPSANGHWPSEFKLPGHPNQFVPKVPNDPNWSEEPLPDMPNYRGLVDTKTGKIPTLLQLLGIAP